MHVYGVSYRASPAPQTDVAGRGGPTVAQGYQAARAASNPRLGLVAADQPRTTRTPSGAPTSTTSARRRAKMPFSTTPGTASMRDLEPFRVGEVQAGHIEDRVAAVGDEARADGGRAAERREHARRCLDGLRQHLHGHGDAAEPLRELGLVDDADEEEDAVATAFSRVCAPPPPLMSLSRGSTSSAPST